MEEGYLFSKDLIESFVHKLQSEDTGNFYTPLKKELAEHSEIEFSPDDMPVKRKLELPSEARDSKRTKLED